MEKQEKSMYNQGTGQYVTEDMTSDERLGRIY
jgi:hypothetical protein